MNPNQLALLLRQYAQALETLEVMKSWIAEYGSKVERVRVDWNTASAVIGYAPVSDAVSRDLTACLPRMFDAALAHQAQVVQDLAAQVRRAQQ